MKRLAFAFLALAACGGDDGGSNTIDAPGGGSNKDAPATQVDAPSNVPTMVTISGTVKEVTTSGQTPVSGATITAYQQSGDAMIATTTSGADGTFSISAPTNGSPVVAYLVSKKTNDVDTYLYPPYPLTKDFANVPVLMLTPQNRDLAGTIAQVSIDDTKGWIGTVVTDATMNPVTGAVVTSTPMGTVRYNGSNGLPATMAKATSTAADGIAYDWNVTPGNVSVTATATGMTFQAHSINARAGVVTLTLITP